MFDLKAEFVYLAVVLDAFSRKVVGWSVDRTLQSRLPLNALEKAIANRQPPPGLVHHSDRGVQYACEDYIQVLRDHQMMPSMSRPGNPYDNASCESFMKTLKREEIYANDYRDLEHLIEGVEKFIEHYYNRCRLHSNVRAKTGTTCRTPTRSSMLDSRVPCAQAMPRKHAPLRPNLSLSRVP